METCQLDSSDYFWKEALIGDCNDDCARAGGGEWPGQPRAQQCDGSTRVYLGRERPHTTVPRGPLQRPLTTSTTTTARGTL